MHLCSKKSWVAAVLENGGVEIRELDRGRLVQTISDSNKVNSAKFNRSGDSLIVGARQGSVIRFRTNDWTTAAIRELGRGGIYEIAISPVGDSIGVCTGGGWVELLDAESLEPIQNWKLGARLASLTFSADGKRLIGAGLDGNAYMIDIQEALVTSRRVAESGLLAVRRLGEDSIVFLASGAAISLDINDSGAQPQEILRGPAVASAVTVDDTGCVTIGSGDGSMMAKSSEEASQQVAHFGTAINDIAWWRGTAAIHGRPFRWAADPNLRSTTSGRMEQSRLRPASRRHSACPEIAGGDLG